MNVFTIRNFTTREKQFLLAGLTAALVALFCIWLNVSRNQLQAEAALAQSLALAERNALHSRQTGGAEDGRVVSADDMRSLLLDAIARHGLSLSQMQTGGSSELTLEFDDAEPALIFIWLEDLERNARLEPVSARLDARETGNVRASLTFEANGRED